MPLNDRLQLQNPSLVEIWVEFKFSPANPEGAWNADTAEAFLETFGGRFKPVEYGLNYGTQIQTVLEGKGRHFRPLDPQVSFDVLRASTDDSYEWMVVGKDSLLSSLVPAGDKPLGYSALKAKASEVLDLYFAHFQPDHVVQAALHYRDVVKLPTVDMHLRPDEYLTIWIKTPDWVQVPVGRMLLDLSFMSHNDNLLRLRLQSEPSPDTFARFRMDWHLTCQRIQSSDRDGVWDRLDKAHEQLIENFWRSFTPQGQQLLGRIGP